MLVCCQLNIKHTKMEKHEQVAYLVDFVELLIKELDPRPEHAKLLRLAFYGDKSWEELSAATGLGPMKVKTEFRRAFSLLKLEMEKNRRNTEQQAEQIRLLLQACETLPLEQRKKILVLTMVEDLDLTVRALACLKGAGIKTLGQLVSYSVNDLFKFRNFGHKTIHEIEELLGRMDLDLRANS